jgi:hypothetical protein
MNDDIQEAADDCAKETNKDVTDHWRNEQIQVSEYRQGERNHALSLYQVSETLDLSLFLCARKEMGTTKRTNPRNNTKR